ncbi:hypothetical protein GPROT2_00178 [Gammaproteobacteria bacterium]|nr:hypothetical protein GPROT2_00178 [Gammaproteobacteria bacterium]
MIISFNLLMVTAAAVVAGSLTLSLLALGLGWRATRRSASALTAAGIAQLRAAEAEAALAACAEKLQALQAERERAGAVATRPGLRQAVALSRHGASTEELVAACRIGQSEARLIQMLYGGPKTAAATPATGMH